MYNDYYLQLINNKMDDLQEIIDNQEIIIEQQQQLISGDKTIINNQEEMNNSIILNAMLITLGIIFAFIVRSMR